MLYSSIVVLLCFIQLVQSTALQDFEDFLHQRRNSKRGKFIIFTATGYIKMIFQKEPKKGVGLSLSCSLASQKRAFQAGRDLSLQLVMKRF